MKDIFGKEVKKEMIVKEIIENSDIFKIRKKYSMLREEISKKNNPKFVKKQKEKLYYLKNEDEIDISQDVALIGYRYNELEEILKIIKVIADWKEINQIRILQLLVSEVEYIIYSEYHNLLNRKNIRKDEYFSNIDYVDIAEICELVKCCYCYYSNLYEILFKITDEKILEQDDHYLRYKMESCENILNYLSWIFSNSTIEEQPYYIF